tara:strand:+ start:244 stop:954 length:711 start_codon:yes stop_codon:yes gene_type:complete
MVKRQVLLAAVLSVWASSVFAQDNVIAQRMRFCSINPGYSMADVVETARAFEWSDSTAPGVVIFREAIAVSADFEYDFILDSYYPSYSDLVEKRVAFRNRPGGRNGRGFADVATCAPRAVIASVRFAVPPGGSLPQASPTAVARCEMNGATLADAMTAAEGLSQATGGRGAVAMPTFGGTRTEMGSTVSMRVYFPSTTGFGEAMDRLQQNPQGPSGDMSCSTPSLWLSHLVFARNN